MRPDHGRRPMLSAVLALAILGGAVGVYFALENGGARVDVAESTIDCVQGSDVGRAVFLIDLQKPLDAAHAALPGDLLRQAAGEVAAGTELAAYTLSPHADAPRTLIGRLCKNFDVSDLAAAAAKHRLEDECDVPAQAPTALRASAKEFCRQRDALARRIDALVLETLGQAPGATHLVEALEATAREFGDAPGSLYVFSDLLQHSAWFSHTDRPLEEWDFEQMAVAWRALPFEEPLRGFAAETRVRIHYIPRIGTTEQEDWQTTHKRFWSAYFAGAEIQFDNQPTMAEYVPAALGGAPTAMELAAYELERLRHSSAMVERDRNAIERDRSSIEEDRAEIERDRRELDNARRQIATERQELAALRAQLEARARTLAGAGDDAALSAEFSGGI